ncbi:MAG: KTSC domain-containing protein [Bauldia sp.]|nr:KTSC domain-containing protein [Bauldia sp.]
MPSQAIRSFDYDAARNELTVTFARGHAYVYSLVPEAVAAALAESPRKGAFHNDQIRDRYPFRKVKAAPSAASSLREALIASAEAEDAPLPPARQV